MERIYRFDIDLLKGLAILAVVFYHAGFLTTGYLGVDAFFVINGFLIIPPLLAKKMMTWGGYLIWLNKRIIRLLPLLLIISVVCLAAGFVGMLPDDYENLSQSVVASNIFANNILQAITTKNYWDVVNDYKPLMHTWYLGILMQFYIVYPLVVMLVNRISNQNVKKCEEWNYVVLLSLTIVSLMFYLNPSFSEGDRFYMLPSRFFEIGIGGIIGFYYRSKNWRINSACFIFTSLFLFVLILISGWIISSNTIGYDVVGGTIKDCSLLIPKQVILLAIVAVTAILLSGNQDNDSYKELIRYFKPIVFIGVMSYSIFLWHQVIFAFFRCYIGPIGSVFSFLLLLVVSLLLSSLSYWLIEKKIHYSARSIVVCGIIWLMVIFSGMGVYMKAGVVRDVPEMDIIRDSAKRGMFAEYCDRVYKYDKEFPKPNGKINVLVEGYSFGRDFANILLESQFAGKINLSYIFLFEKKYNQRYKEADYVFAVSSKKEIPEYVNKNIKDDCLIYGLGPKNFGTNNSIFYIRRGSDDYFKSTAEIDKGFFVLNKLWKEEWGDLYVDFLSIVQESNNSVRVFTDNNKYISQDCRHLTPEGAKYYARKLPLKSIFNN